MKFKRIIAAVLTLAVAATALPQIVTERRAMFAEEGAAEEETTEETSEPEEEGGEEGTTEEASEAEEEGGEEGTTEEASEAEEEPDDDSEYTWIPDWNFDGDGLALYKYNGAGGDVVIPGEVDGKKVTQIYSDAFSRCTSLTSVVIPDGVMIIDDGAFSGCTALTSVVIPNGVKNIGSQNDPYGV